MSAYPPEKGDNMRIVMLGNFSVPYCSESIYKVELESLGHEVVPLQENAVTVEDLTRAIFDEPFASDEWINAMLKKPRSYFTNGRHRAELFIWVHSHGYEIQGNHTMAQLLETLKFFDIPTVAYHLDLYMPIPRWKEYEHSDYFNKVDYFFTVDKLMADWLNWKGITKAYYMRAGAFSGQNYLADYDSEYASDIAFIGSKGYHPEWTWRPKLIDWLQKTYGDRFIHWGPDGRELVREEKFNKVCASTKVIVGDSLVKDFNYPFYWSERVYNITGAGGFILHPAVRGLVGEYGDYFGSTDEEQTSFTDKELATFEFNDLKDLKAKIDYYLDHEKERQEMRIRAYNRTTEQHLYKHRWETILKTVK